MNTLEEIREHIESTHADRAQSYDAIVVLDIKMITFKNPQDLKIVAPHAWVLCVDNEFFYCSKDFVELDRFLNSFNHDLIIWTYWLGGLYYNCKKIFGEDPEINLAGHSKFFPREIVTKNRLIFRDVKSLSKMSIEDMRTQFDLPNSAAIICKWITELKKLLKVERTKSMPYSQGKLYRIKMYNSEAFDQNGWKIMADRSIRRYRDGNGIWDDVETYRKFNSGFKNGLITRDNRKDGQYIPNVLYADITSAYPAVMYTKKLPWAFKHLRLQGPQDPNFIFSCVVKEDESCCFAKFTFTNIILKKEAPCATIIVDNNFLEYASSYCSYMTDIEYKIICKFYNFDSVVCEDIYKSNLVYLTDDEKAEIFDTFKEKQKAKNTPQYDFYKIIINSNFGNKCRKMERKDMEYTYKNKDYYYPEGVWIAAWQRKIMADIIWELGKDFIYTNTDSVVCNDTPRARQIIEAYNRTVIEQELGRFKIEECKRFYMVGPSKYCIWYKDERKKIVFGGIHQRYGNLTESNLEEYAHIGVMTIQDAQAYPVYIEGPFTCIIDGETKTIEECLYLEFREKTFTNKNKILDNS